MHDWVLAESIDELKEFLISDPPPYFNRPSSMKDNTLQVNPISKQKFLQIGNEILSSSRGLLSGTIGVILFSVLNWVDISFFGFSLRFNLFSLYKVLNNSFFIEIVDISREIALSKIAVVILNIVLLLSFALLIIALVKHKLKCRSLLAYCGFALCVIVSGIFIIAMVYIGVEIEHNLLTVFPFLTMGSAIVSMIFFVKRPDKIDFTEILKEFKWFNYQTADEEPQMKSKKRHDLVTIWLWLLIGGCCISILAGNGLPFFSWVAWFAAFLDIVFIYLLFNDKKNGFWGLCSTAILGMFSYFVVSKSFESHTIILTALGIVINYAVFQIKNDGVSFWNQLENTKIENDIKEVLAKLKRN